jgi:hypothetical protein
MENVPLTAEDDSEKKDSSKRKKKSVEKLGLFAVEPKTEEPKVEKTGGTLRELFDRQPETTPTKSTGETADDASEKAETPPLEILSDDEKQLARREIVQAERLIEADHPRAEVAEEAAVEEAAIEYFRDLVEEGQEPEQALNETIAELDDGQEIEAAPTEIHEFNEDEVHVVDHEAVEADEATTSTRPVAAGGGHGTPPPRRPVTHGGTPPPAGPIPPSPAFAGSAPSVAPVVERVPVYIDRNPLGDMLIGGIIGYFIGRRRGRIKTEKKLLPVQKKLERQVEQLRQDITDKEYQIRAAAKQYRRASARSVPEKFVAAVEKRSLALTEQSPVKMMERPRSFSTETPQTGEKAPERLGHLTVEAAGSRQPVRSEKPEPPELAMDRKVLTMNRVELLKLSEKIEVNGTSLRQIYETKLVGEQGLRRLVNEHLSGGDVKRRLRREIVEREIDFERDPVLRDKAFDNAAGGGNSSNLSSLLQKAGAALPAESEETAFYKARAAYEVSEQARQQTRRRAVDGAFISIIVILAILVVLLFLDR